MTLEEFHALTRSRIPTPGEFVAFAEAMGWKLLAAGGGQAALRVPDGRDALARALARMLSREPYRTNVLAALAGTWRDRPAEPPAPQLPADVRALCDAVAARRPALGEALAARALEAVRDGDSVALACVAAAADRTLAREDPQHVPAHGALPLRESQGVRPAEHLGGALPGAPGPLAVAAAVAGGQGADAGPLLRGLPAAGDPAERGADDA